MTIVAAKDTTINNIYHSPKGIPCKVISISDSSVTVKSLITMQEIIIPINLPMIPYTESLDKDAYSNKVVKKSD